MQYTRHPLSALLPDPTPEERAGLRESILAVGILDAIVIHDGQVLDGWNRYSIAAEEQVECPSIPLDAGIDPVEYVRSRTRGRNMNPSQLALLEVQLHAWRGDGRPAGNPEPGSALSSAEMGARIGVSDRTIRQAKAVFAQASEPVKAAVKDGKLSVKRGAEIAKLPVEEQEQALHAPPPAAAAGNPEPGSGLAEESGYESPTDIMEEQERVIRDLQEQLASASAADAAAENLRLRKLLQDTERRLHQTMANAAQHQSDLRKASDTIRRLCTLLDLNDTRRVVAAVEALLKGRAAA